MTLAEQMRRRTDTVIADRKSRLRESILPIFNKMLDRIKEAADEGSYKIFVDYQTTTGVAQSTEKREELITMLQEHDFYICRHIDGFEVRWEEMIEIRSFGHHLR